MARYHTSLSLAELDPIIQGDMPLLDFRPFRFRHRGERKEDRFVLRRSGMVIRGKLEPQGGQLFIELRPQYTLAILIALVIGVMIAAMFLFAEPLSINGEAATPASRLAHLPIALLFPALVLLSVHMQMRFWLAKVVRSMQLERLA